MQSWVFGYGWIRQERTPGNWLWLLCSPKKKLFQGVVGKVERTNCSCHHHFINLLYLLSICNHLTANNSALYLPFSTQGWFSTNWQAAEWPYCLQGAKQHSIGSFISHSSRFQLSPKPFDPLCRTKEEDQQGHCANGTLQLSATHGLRGKNENEQPLATLPLMRVAVCVSHGRVSHRASQTEVCLINWCQWATVKCSVIVKLLNYNTLFHVGSTQAFNGAWR